MGTVSSSEQVGPGGHACGTLGTEGGPLGGQRPGNHSGGSTTWPGGRVKISDLISRRPRSGASPHGRVPAMTSHDVVGLSHAELVELVVELSQRVDALAGENERLRAEAAKNSANSSKPSSRDPVAERKRQAEERRAKKARAAGGKKRRPGKQPGAPGNTLEMTGTPDEVIDHAPESCSGCGAGLGDAEVVDVARRQVIDIPVPHRSRPSTGPGPGAVAAGRRRQHRSPRRSGPR